MPFFQSMAVRFGVKSFLENCGIDEEAAGWLAAGASLATAVVTADLHGHIAGEAASHIVSHGASHIASHGASHAVSHGTSHIASHGASHAVSHGTSHIASHGSHSAASHLRTGHIPTNSYGYDPVLQSSDPNTNVISHDARNHLLPHIHHSGDQGTFPSGHRFETHISNNAISDDKNYISWRCKQYGQIHNLSPAVFQQHHT